MNWVHRGYVFLQESMVMTQRTFNCCSIFYIRVRPHWKIVRKYFLISSQTNIRNAVVLYVILNSLPLVINNFNMSKDAFRGLHLIRNKLKWVYDFYLNILTCWMVLGKLKKTHFVSDGYFRKGGIIFTFFKVSIKLNCGGTFSFLNMLKLDHINIFTKLLIMEHNIVNKCPPDTLILLVSWHWMLKLIFCAFEVRQILPNILVTIDQGRIQRFWKRGRSISATMVGRRRKF